MKSTIPAPKVALPKPIEHWFLNPVAVQRLREIMEDEHFLTAIATLKEAAGPTSSSVSTDQTANSNRLSWYAGYRDAFSDLAKLTKIPARTKQTNDEWMHL